MDGREVMVDTGKTSATKKQKKKKTLACLLFSYRCRLASSAALAGSRPPSNIMTGLTPARSMTSTRSMQ